MLAVPVIVKDETYGVMVLANCEPREFTGEEIQLAVMLAEQAALAIENGADGIIVSNHGGRNCDAAPAPIEVLPDIAKAVGHKTTIVFDSGVRRGSDVVKALALGAKMVLIGRSTLYGTAAAGYDGAARALELYRGEISRGMANVSCNRVSEIGRQHVILPQVRLAA